MNQSRQRTYVDSAVQGGIVLRLVVFWLGTLAICILLALVIGWFANPLMPFEQQFEQQLRNLWPILVATVVVLPIGVLRLIRFTHRFAGPVLRLSRGLDDLAAGKPVEPIKFRDGDYWPELADAFNRIRDERAPTTRKASLALEAEAAQLVGDGGGSTSA